MVNYVTEIKSQTYFILILIGLPFCYDDINYSTSSGTKIEPMSYARDLGVQMSSDYTWDHHKGKKIILNSMSIKRQISDHEWSCYNDLNLSFEVVLNTVVHCGILPMQQRFKKSKTYIDNLQEG